MTRDKRGAVTAGQRGAVTIGLQLRPPSHDGPDEAVLAALAARRFAGLPRLEPAPDVAREQPAGDLDAALRHLREVRDCSWDYDWRKEHRGLGHCPEHELWEAAGGYLDILDASGPPSPGTRRR